MPARAGWVPARPEAPRPLGFLGGRTRARDADRAPYEDRDARRADGVGRRRIERLRAGQRRERALEPGGDEDRRVAGGAEIEIAPGVAPLAREERHGDRRRQHEPGGVAGLAGEQRDQAHERARRRPGDVQHGVHELGKAKRDDGRDDQRQRVAQAAALGLDARQRRVRRGHHLADPRREAEQHAQEVHHRLRSWMIASPRNVSMSSHSSMLRASAAISGASPPVPTTRGAKSTSALMRSTMASTRPA